MEESAQATFLYSELAALRQRVAALEAEVTVQHATLTELQDSLEEQGLMEAELRQELAAREATQQAIEAERQQYQTLFELAPDGYLVTDAAGVICEANRAAVHLLGRRERLVGLPLSGFVAREAHQTFSRLLRSLRTASQEQAWEVCFSPPRAQPFVGELTVAIRQGEQLADTRYHWLLRDITARKQAEAALCRESAERQRLEREAQRAEHFALLGRLAAGVSHEIRNPLGAVVLHVDLLEEELHQPSPDSPAQVAQSLTEIKTHLARLEDLVQDHLSLVRVHASQLEVQDLGAALQTWAAELQGQTAARGVTLQQEGLAGLGQVAFHGHTLRRALLNLVQNALDAMASGGTVTLTGQGTATQVQVQVRDTGSGMPADTLPLIFEPLYTTKPGGTGLGLYVVQEIVAAHGGQVTVESVEDQGTTVTLTLPRPPAEASAARQRTG